MSDRIGIRAGGWRRALTVVGFVVCVVVDTAVVYAVFESPFGTILILDDDLPEGYVLVPVLAGAALGALQRIALGTPTAVAAAIVVALGGVASLFFVFPAGVVAFGCLLGAVAALPVRRRVGDPGSALALIAVLVGGTLAARYGATRPDPADVPLLEVTAVEGGPSLVVDPQRRADGGQVTGVLTNVDGCLGLTVSSREGRQFVVAWEDGTSASGRPYVLDLAGRSHRLGDLVTLPGSAYITLPEDLAAYAPDLPTSCRGTDLILAG